MPRLYITALMALVLLLSQITGLHQHRHIEAADGGEHHGAQLHFEDVGLHEQDPAHAHHGELADTAHPHTDIETKVLDSGLLKNPNLDAGLAFLLACWFVFQFSWLRHAVVPAPAVPPPRKLRLYALRPPANAPPLTSTRSV